MVRAHVACTVEEAFVLMHEPATMSGVTMKDIIDAVVQGVSASTPPRPNPPQTGNQRRAHRLVRAMLIPSRGNREVVE